MIDYLVEVDKQLLLYLNGFDSLYWGRVVWLFTSTRIWIPLILALVYFLFKKGDWREMLFVIIALALVITICDQIASSVCKPFFERYRPTHDPTIANLITTVNGYKGGRFGFVSSHAANSMGVALFTSLLFRKPSYTIGIFLWAILNSYTRIYLGVHFPGDIIFGSILGLIVGYFIYRAYTYFHGYFYTKNILRSPYSPYLHVQVRLPLITLYATYAFILLFSLI